MMLHRKLGKSTLVAIICLVMFSITGFSVLAAEPHEDPETASPVFSDVALLRYYADSLDFVLSRNPAEVEARLEKMPFASLPPSLAEATDSFVASSTNLSYRVVVIDADLGKLVGLVGQFRVDEAIELAGHISDNLSQMDSELRSLEQATETIGEELKVSSAPAGSDLRLSYDGVVERINRIREMLVLYADLTGEQLKLMDIILEGLFKSTHITLEIQPRVAFVGDDIRFEGVLTAQGEPLAGKDVDILLNGSPYITVRTDADGRYLRMLPVPYRYTPELNWQALYYPRDKDIGLYMASLSPVIKLNVLFYEAGLEVTVEPRAYPGRETVVSGRFDYGQSPPPNERKAQIYLDGLLMTEVVVQEAFTQKIKIDAETDFGRHTITVSSAAVGRYMPVVARAILNVTRVIPNLAPDLPPVILTPGGIGLEGKLSSEVGPLNEALVGMGLGGSQVELVSSGEGASETRKRWWMVWGFIGWQDLVVKVIPDEAGAVPLFFTTRVMVVNVINLAIFLALLAILGFFISWRLKRFRILALLAVFGPFLSWILKKFRVFHGRRKAGPMVAIPQTVAIPQKEPAPVSSHSVSVAASTEEKEPDSGEPRSRIFNWYRLVVRFLLRILKKLRVFHGRRKAGPMVAIPQNEPAPASSYSVSVSAAAAERETDNGEPRGRIFYWYRLVMRFLLRIAKIPLRPQQTMREFADEHSRVLGPGAKYFNELTRMVERLLYSPYRPTEADVENSRQMSLRVEEEAELEINRLSFGGEGRLPDKFVRRAEGLKVGGRVLIPSPWRWLSTWLRRN